MSKLVEDSCLNSEIRKILIIKLIEAFYHENEKPTAQFNSYEPSQIYFVGNIKNPNHLSVSMNQKLYEKHEFMAPEELFYHKVSEVSVVWNLALLIDYILCGKPFFSSLEEIRQFKGT